LQQETAWCPSRLVAVDQDAPMRRGTRPGALVLLIALVGLTGCTDDGGSDPRKTSGQVAAESVTVQTRITRIAGRLPPERRRRLEAQVARLVDDYVTASFVAGAGGDDAFPGFTPGARRRAMQDLAVLTGRDLVADEVRAERAAAYLAVFAHRYRAQGATARLELDLAVPTEDGTATVRVRGRLLLTPTSQGWRIFGYDLTQGPHR
jgi:hypothetical protein